MFLEKCTCADSLLIRTPFSNEVVLAVKPDRSCTSTRATCVLLTRSMNEFAGFDRTVGVHLARMKHYSFVSTHIFISC
jgi:hypothetical protein